MRADRPGEITIFGRTYKTPKVMFWLIAGPFLLWLLWALFLVRAVAMAAEWIGKWDALTVSGGLTTLGQTGDVFGGVNALFAAYAFVGVAVAAYFQHKTFVVVEEQQRQQAFEPLFFKLLELNRGLRPTKLPANPAWGTTAMGEDTGENFGPAVESLASALLEPIEKGELAQATTSELTAFIDKEYGQFYRQDEAILGPYFRTLYHVFKLIETSGLPKNKRIEYANIGRASINRDELVLLLFNCVTKQGAEFKPLVETYGLLKHLPVFPRNQRRLAQRLYRPTAVMNSDEREKHWTKNPTERPLSMSVEA